MAFAVAEESVIPIEAVLLSLAILVASGRLVPRLVQRLQLTVSDGFLVASIINAMGLFATDTMTYKWGGMADDDAPEPSTDGLIALKKVQFAGNVFYDTGIYWPKLAVLALYFRLFPPTMPWLRRMLYAVTALTACAMWTTFFLDTFWCGTDVSLNWSTDETACSTFDSKEVFRIDWATNVTSDVFSEHYEKGQVVFSMAEMAVAIMVVSLPSMRSFLRRGGIFSSNKSSGGSLSRSKYGAQTPIAGSGGFTRYSLRGKPSARTAVEEDAGSQVELNGMGRKDVIYATRRISVEFTDRAAYDSRRPGKQLS
ncbi:hypothetical protein ACEQ8H_002282 [Pleosporales sp. CAS-2024a]